MPGDEPTLLYALARNEGVPGDRITSQFYRSFLLPSGRLFLQRPRKRGRAAPPVLGFLGHSDPAPTPSPPGTPLEPVRAGLQGFIADNPQWFSQTAPDEQVRLVGGWLVSPRIRPTRARPMCTGCKGGGGDERT